MAKILLLLLVSVGLATATKFDCESRACDRGTKHTTCLYKSPKPHPRCGKVLASSVTPQEKQEIVKFHNYYRRIVAEGRERRGRNGPQPAGDIGPLKWNDRLAEVAQRWANQCLPGHDQCRSDGDHYIGQNKGMKGSFPTEPELSLIIKDWYDEVKDFDKDEVDSLRDSGEFKIGHYTQLVSGRSTEIGCGIIKNIVPKVIDRKRYQMRQTTLVCNYGPGGNIIGEPVYKARH